MKYAWIDEHKAQWSVAELCRSVGVSSSGYYAHKQRIGESKQQGIDAHLRQTIEQQCKSHKGRYGRPRMTAQLRKLGWVVNHKRVGKIMKQMGLQCQLRRKHKICTTQSKHSYSVAPKVLDRCFTQNAPNQAWSADITYIHTAEGWLFAALVIDLFSKKIVGWALGETMAGWLTQEALRTALLNRQPKRGLIHHSDRGSQYAAHDYRHMLSACGITVSMSRRGNCWDNAAMESVNGTFKVECVNRQTYLTREHARYDALEFIGYYNTQRIHSSLGYLTPQEFEANWQGQASRKEVTV